MHDNISNSVIITIISGTKGNFSERKNNNMAVDVFTYVKKKLQAPTNNLSESKIWMLLFH